jgi:hypothetical protein
MDAHLIRQTGWALYGASWVKPLARGLARHSDLSQDQWERRLRSATDRSRPTRPDPVWHPAFCQLLIQELGKRPSHELMKVAQNFC